MEGALVVGYFVGFVVNVLFCIVAIDTSRYDEDKKRHTRILFMTPLWPILFTIFSVKKFIWAFNIPTKRKGLSHD